MYDYSSQLSLTTGIPKLYIKLSGSVKSNANMPYAFMRTFKQTNTNKHTYMHLYSLSLSLTHTHTHTHTNTVSPDLV